MVNTHDIDLGTLEFEQLRNNNYIIIQTNDIEVGDYVLFKQTEANLFVMTQVKEIIQNEGLKEGYGLLILSKLN